MVKPSLIQTKIAWADYLERTIHQTEEFEKLDPNWELLKGIHRQLDFMKSCAANGRTPTSEEGSRVNVGPIAAKNLEDSQPEYAEWLMELDYAFRHWQELT
jgi:hypothetical protein